MFENKYDRYFKISEGKIVKLKNKNLVFENSQEHQFIEQFDKMFMKY